MAYLLTSGSGNNSHYFRWKQMPLTTSSSDKSCQLHLIISPMVQLTHITTQFIKLKRKGFVCSNNCFINIKLVKNVKLQIWIHTAFLQLCFDLLLGRTPTWLLDSIRCHDYSFITIHMAIECDRFSQKTNTILWNKMVTIILKVWACV